MTEETRFITNPGPAVLQVLFEPWSMLHELPAGETFRIVGTSPQQGSMEVVETNDLVTVYGWPGSTLQVFQGEALLDDPALYIGVPDLPPGMSMRAFTELMFGGPG
jgi:hypothetical protein